MLTKKIAINCTLWAIMISFTSCFFRPSTAKETKVEINTTLGKIVVKLYDQTPKTRDNFIKLVKRKFYDSTLFHRVIKSFMIQGGDPDSKHATQGVVLGNGDVGYTVPAEVVPGLIHKRGALATARQGDDVNPSKASSGCQFYIVQGKVFTNAELDRYELNMNRGIKQKIFMDIISKPENAAYKQKFMEYQNNNDIDSLRALSGKFEPLIDSMYAKVPHFQFTPEQRQAYTTVGGAPHLDGNYTVFGEVIEGIDIVDKIEDMKVDANNRPLQDVRIISMRIIK